MKIVVIGGGYVGFSTAVMFSTKYQVSIIDLNPFVGECIDKKVSPFKDELITEYLNDKNLNLSFSEDLNNLLPNTDYCILSLPTNFDEDTGFFDTDLIESYIKKITKLNSKTIIIIKSTVPIGFTKSMSKKFKNKNIIFCPEFLREGSALKDNLFPSRLILGGTKNISLKVRDLINNATLSNDYDCLQTTSSEAEAIKLFSNTFLAARVSFFNEIDSYAMQENLSAEKIIKGISLDPRVGNYYNNPSFGFGGYCLPKDTKQLLANLNKNDSPLIQSINKSNSSRKKVIARHILQSGARTIGIYRLVMKAGSDNFRETALSGVIDELLDNQLDVIIYEPLLNEDYYQDAKVISDFNSFIDSTDLIVANRIDDQLHNYKYKIYSRDIYSVD